MTEREKPERHLEPIGDADPDFADEHSQPTFADQPPSEEPDESVPEGRAGMD
ncbi:hypothetical protein [Actinophytocola xanthii]|uniref:hypothetical protein n=1 Tax=Actinophytocola xanthii TaxID=1912961 RepID=UPI00130108B2|nr:hypothetical protein [Actinophytocola xanthii]